MSKEKAIANIVKDLDKLSLDQNQQILSFIRKAKEDNKKEKQDKSIHKDRDGTPIAVGDTVYLLTKGVYNYVGQEATIFAVPSKSGEYITLLPIRKVGTTLTLDAIHKFGRSVRKKQQE